VFASTTFAATAAGDGVLRQIRVGHARDAFVVGRAVEVAARRLEDVACLEVLSVFHDARGNTLAEVLAAQGRTAPDHLRRLLFYSGTDRPQCRGDALAWTVPGSHVVFVCPDRLRNAYAINPARVEAVILHEMLHTLGLGENPPRSLEITSRVEAACGG
jgi:hypothetical protein